jgi:hypothetical protein
MADKYIPAEQRFWRLVTLGDGCWERGGSDRHGYGLISIHNRQQLAHRYSWELHNGPIPTGINVCHHCDNPRCVRPDHLFLGTQKDNLRDMSAKGRGWKQADTHCINGHEYATHGRYVDHTGKRQCRTCALDAQRRYKQRKKAALA